MRKERLWVYLLCVLVLVLLVLVICNDQPQPKPERQPLPTVTPSPEPTATPVPSPSPTKTVFKGVLELPIQGATGFASIDLNLRSAPSAQSGKLRSVAAGTAFRILGEQGAYWQVEGEDFKGYLAHQYCMINLPDVIPSIVYENTNASKSILVTSGKAIPGVTGQRLYASRSYNERLGKDEYIMPVLYAMAKKIRVAQQTALDNGSTLKIYEAYRPYSAQQRVVRAVDKLSDEDEAVRRGIESELWSVSWFVAQKVSYHQRGCAIDVSLAKVNRTEARSAGAYRYTVVTDYDEYDMPTQMHELSIAAAAFAAPVSSTSLTAWKSAKPAAGTTEAARTLQKYLTDAGLTPLASEWWHFNDMQTFLAIRNSAGLGGTTFTKVLSVAPK